MYCSNCGKEVIGNFCSNCGYKLDNSTLKLNCDENVLRINNIDVNMSEVIRLFGKNRIKAIKYIRNITNLGLKEAKEVVDNYYNVYYSDEKKLSFSEKIKLKNEQSAKKFRELQTTKRELDKKNIAYCPKCGSTSLSAGNKGLDLGSSIIGASLFGTIGLMAGAGDTESIKVTCLKCGHQFKAGKSK